MATYLKNRAFGLIAGATPVQPKHFTVPSTWKNLLIFNAYPANSRLGSKKLSPS